MDVRVSYMHVHTTVEATPHISSALLGVLPGLASPFTSLTGLVLGGAGHLQPPGQSQKDASGKPDATLSLSLDLSLLTSAAVCLVLSQAWPAFSPAAAMASFACRIGAKGRIVRTCHFWVNCATLCGLGRNAMFQGAVGYLLGDWLPGFGGHGDWDDLTDWLGGGRLAALGQNKDHVIASARGGDSRTSLTSKELRAAAQKGSLPDRSCLWIDSAAELAIAQKPIFLFFFLRLICISNLQVRRCCQDYALDWKRKL